VKLEPAEDDADDAKPFIKKEENVDVPIQEVEVTTSASAYNEPGGWTLIGHSPRGKYLTVTAGEESTEAMPYVAPNDGTGLATIA
jgi:hypothetical protein